MLGVEVHRDRVTEGLAHLSIADMPEIPRPDLLELRAFHQLCEGRFDPPTALAKARTALRIGIVCFVPEGRGKPGGFRRDTEAAPKRPDVGALGAGKAGKQDKGETLIHDGDALEPYPVISASSF